MRTRTDLPHAYEIVEHESIAMPDAVRLAARIWLPKTARTEPVPAILEYIPYRRRDITRKRDTVMHSYFAGHGYACIRVDLRGSGDSEGVLTDEYLEQELRDGECILAWVANQPWCNGNVGMIGISWGGFNSLQIAARRPKPLKAVVAVCATDDRYTDDVHYMGGCLLGDNLSWASTMFAYNACPPDPAIVGDAWREMWHERLRGSGLWIANWLQHQRRDAYWRHGSVNENYAAIQCPVMTASGWTDGYTNAVFRLLENLEAPRKALVGPWGHKYPHLGMPGPAVGFLQTCVRWWDQWLKGVETGIMNEPTLLAYMQDSCPPTTRYSFRPGRWVCEDTWPSRKVRNHIYKFDQARIVAAQTRCDPTPRTVQSPLTTGLFAGKWCSYTAAPDLPHDQREDDGGALTFTGEPLDEELEILGAPSVELMVSADKPVAMIAVRLSDVLPNDQATRITYGILNLTHRDDHGAPEPLRPGEKYRVRIQMNDVAQAFPKGHRLRVSISTSYWPLAWPPPEPVRLTVFPAESRLDLPVREKGGREAAGELMGEPEGAPSPPETMLEPVRHNWFVHRDLAGDVSTLEVIKDEGLKRLDDIETTLLRNTKEWYSSRGNEFDSVRGETLHEWGFQREGMDWNTRTMTRTVLTSDPKRFYVHAELDAYEGDRRVFSKNWDERIDRDLV